MNLDIARGDRFTLTLDSGDLAKGLRPSKRTPRNSGHLITCDGAVGRDGVLQTLDEMTRLATAVITDGFPYPQIFPCINVIIVCGETKIYEWVSGALSAAKVTVTAGSTWSVVDLYEYIYLTNGKVAVVRSASTKTYSTTTDIPFALAACNLDGQVILGAPDVDWS